MKASLLQNEARKKLLNFYAGLAEYSAAQITPWQITGKVVWQEGSTRIFEYGKGEPVLVISPLINKPAILNELMQHLAQQGFCALLVDWGTPTDAEINFDANAYIERLKRFYKPNMHVVGYCMGGILALKLATSAAVKSLALIATPWDFAHINKLPTNFLGAGDFVPPEVISSLFTYADLFSVYDKFSALPDMPPAKKQEFCTVEYWVNDGVPMARPLAKECIEGWVGKNKVDINISDIKTKTLVCVAMHDKIVPINSSLPLLGLLQNSELCKLPSGHIGIITKKLVHKPLVDWLHAF